MNIVSPLPLELCEDLFATDDILAIRTLNKAEDIKTLSSKVWSSSSSAGASNSQLELRCFFILGENMGKIIQLLDEKDKNHGIHYRGKRIWRKEKDLRNF